jgi:hypothetical protein
LIFVTVHGVIGHKRRPEFTTEARKTQRRKQADLNGHGRNTDKDKKLTAKAQRARRVREFGVFSVRISGGRRKTKKRKPKTLSIRALRVFAVEFLPPFHLPLPQDVGRAERVERSSAPSPTNRASRRSVFTPPYFASQPGRFATFVTFTLDSRKPYDEN